MKEVIRFVADDGTVFESKESCEIYEQNCEEIINLRFDKIQEVSQYDCFKKTMCDAFDRLLIGQKGENA